MINTDCQINPLEMMVKEKFPEVEKLRVDHLNMNVKGIDYVRSTTDPNFFNNEGMQRESTEIPPVVIWTIEGREYRYVLKPKFNTVRWSMLFTSGTDTIAEYDHELDTVLKCIEMTVQGKSEEEINNILEREHYE